MTYQSIAIVFGPTLLKPEKETGNIAVHTVYQNQIVELILLELNAIFGRWHFHGVQTGSDGLEAVFHQEENLSLYMMYYVCGPRSNLIFALLGEGKNRRSVLPL